MLALARPGVLSELSFLLSSPFPVFLFLFVVLLSLSLSIHYVPDWLLLFILSRLPRSIPPVLPPQSALPPLHLQLLPPLALPFAFPSLSLALSFLVCRLSPLTPHTSWIDKVHPVTKSAPRMYTGLCVAVFLSKIQGQSQAIELCGYFYLYCSLVLPSTVCTEHTCVTSRAPETTRESKDPEAKKPIPSMRARGQTEKRAKKTQKKE
jgi:hypothetical protein